jgi:hypothetical protein
MWRGVLGLALLWLSFISLAGCHDVRLVSAYDDKTDQGVAELSRVTAEFFERQRRVSPPACTYAQQVDFYVSVNAALSVLLERNSGRPENDITNQQLALLGASFRDLEALHKLKKDSAGSAACLSTTDISPLRTGFSAQFSAILKLELAKQRGEE